MRMGTPGPHPSIQTFDAVDRSSNAYVTGYTTSANFPANESVAASLWMGISPLTQLVVVGDEGSLRLPSRTLIKAEGLSGNHQSTALILWQTALTIASCTRACSRNCRSGICYA